MVGQRHDDGDRSGLDDTSRSVADLLGGFVPQFLARRAIAVDVETDAREYERGDTVSIRITFRNRLPVPVTVTTPRRRLWGWAVDGELAASDERPYTRRECGEFAFASRERKVKTREWDGRFERTGEVTEYPLAEAGEHEISAFVATDDRRPSASTTIRLRERE
ncbi:hypothetical protein VB773_02880 [Haloarculaceae archaeon H-GB2-1]|nr:hypothetical protein [Haloarculaceae archaeon H-GB1-1]MEA5388576.1 hypothetical protein [Haloarculaceae archaeon H-GB11]MEA5406630.1 hypothetical protein [Haloarculaceae archaeon H-GB2-1]